MAQGAARPADIFLKGWDRGKDTAVDFTIVSPLRLEDYPLCEENSKRVLSQEESRKVTKYRAMCEQAGWSFVPAAFSIWGSVGPCARSLMNETLRRATADLDGWPKTKKIDGNQRIPTDNISEANCEATKC